MNTTTASRAISLSIVLILSVLTAGITVTGTGASVPHYDTSGESPLAQEQLAQEQQQPVFAPSVFEDIAGQIATEDGEVSVQGTAAGADEVLIAMVDRRGRIASEIVSVDDDDVFEEDVALATPTGTQLSEGPIAAVVFSPGRDGVVGDGEIASFTRADLAALDESTRQRVRQRIGNQTVTRTQAQVLGLFYEESINDSGSDDLALFDVFRFTDGQTSITTVGPQSGTNVTSINPVDTNETMVIRGLTNRKPDDNTITVDVVDGPTPEAFDVADTDQWGTEGVWSVVIEVPPEAEPGTYAIESDDGDNTDVVEVRVRPSDENETADRGTTTS